jgi:hypothetical protein
VPLGLADQARAASAVIVRGTATKDPPLTDASECAVRSRHASRGNDLAVGPKIAKLAARHSERDEGHCVIEMRRHFRRFGPMYAMPIRSERCMAGYQSVYEE